MELPPKREPASTEAEWCAADPGPRLLFPLTGVPDLRCTVRAALRRSRCTASGTRGSRALLLPLVLCCLRPAKPEDIEENPRAAQQNVQYRTDRKFNRFIDGK